MLNFTKTAVAVLSLVVILIAGAGISCSKQAAQTTTTKPSTTTATSLPPSTTTTSVPSTTTPPSTTTSVPPTTTTTPPTSTTTVPPTTTTSPPPTTTGSQVTIIGFAFVPSSITVPAGTRVIWTNQDIMDHTVTSSTPGIFDSFIGAGANISITFTVPGTYNYYCSIHPDMQGIIIVT